MVQYAKSFKFVMLLTLQNKKTWSLNENECFQREMIFQTNFKTKLKINTFKFKLNNIVWIPKAKDFNIWHLSQNWYL